MTYSIAEVKAARKMGAIAYYCGKELIDNPFDREKAPELFAAWEEGFKSEADNWEEFK